MAKFKWLMRFFVILVTLSIFCVYSQKSEEKVFLDNSRLIRLHVIANSDREEDQDLKRQVRDRIITELGPLFDAAQNLEESRNIISENISKIADIAQQEVKRRGYNQGVNVDLGIYPFPTKWYGEFVLPAGKYEALKVVLGEGKGANWWCVLFPPLCFVDVSNNNNMDEGPENLDEIIRKGEQEIQIKFKVIELFESAKGKVDKLIAFTEEP